jgi:hypothetical protein
VLASESNLKGGELNLESSGPVVGVVPGRTTLWFSDDGGPVDEDSVRVNYVITPLPGEKEIKFELDTNMVPFAAQHDNRFEDDETSADWLEYYHGGIYSDPRTRHLVAALTPLPAGAKRRANIEIFYPVNYDTFDDKLEGLCLAGGGSPVDAQGIPKIHIGGSTADPSSFIDHPSCLSLITTARVPARIRCEYPAIAQFTCESTPPEE